MTQHEQPDDSDERRRSIGSRRNPETQEAILEAAEALLLEGGVAGFSIEAVARRARAGKPTIYRWWPNKTALLLEVYHRQKVAPVHNDTGNIETDVALFLTHLMAHWGDTGAGQVFRFIVAEAQRDDVAAEALRRYASERRAQTGKIFRRGIERGELRGDVDAELAAEILSGFAWQRLLTGRLEISAEDASLVARQMVRGLLAPGR